MFTGKSSYGSTTEGLSLLSTNDRENLSRQAPLELRHLSKSTGREKHITLFVDNSKYSAMLLQSKFIDNRFVCDNINHVDSY